MSGPQSMSSTSSTSAEVVARTEPVRRAQAQEAHEHQALGQPSAAPVPSSRTLTGRASPASNTTGASNAARRDARRSASKHGAAGHEHERHGERGARQVEAQRRGEAEQHPVLEVLGHGCARHERQSGREARVGR